MLILLGIFFWYVIALQAVKHEEELREIWKTSKEIVDRWFPEKEKEEDEEEVREIYRKAVGIVDSRFGEEEDCEDEAEKIAKEGAKEELKKLLKEFDRMRLDEVRDKLEEIIWGIGYTEGYEIGYYEGKTGHSYLLKEEEDR